MQFFIKVVFSLCTSLLLLYTSWMKKGKERLKMSDSWFAAFILYCNRTSLVLLTGSFLLLIQLVYNNNKLVHKLKTTLMKICMNRNFYHLSFSSSLDRVSAAS